MIIVTEMDSMMLMKCGGKKHAQEKRVAIVPRLTSGRSRVPFEVFNTTKNIEDDRGWTKMHLFDPALNNRFVTCELLPHGSVIRRACSNLYLA
jgi:hypothetical protein